MRCLSLNGDPIEDPEPTSLAHRFCLLFRDLIPTMNLPSPVLSISPSQLASLICTHCGPEVLEIIHAQKIFDIQTLLRVNDLLAVVRLPTDQFRDLKQKVAVQLHDGTWAILIGFQVRVDAFVNTLRNQARIDEGECDQASNPLPSSDQIVLSAAFIARFPFLASLIEHCSMISKRTERRTSALDSSPTGQSLRESDSIKEQLSIFYACHAFRSVPVHLRRRKRVSICLS